MTGGALVHADGTIEYPPPQPQLLSIDRAVPR